MFIREVEFPTVLTCLLERLSSYLADMFIIEVEFPTLLMCLLERLSSLPC